MPLDYNLRALYAEVPTQGSRGTHTGYPHGVPTRGTRKHRDNGSVVPSLQRVGALGPLLSISAVQSA